MCLGYCAPDAAASSAQILTTQGVGFTAQAFALKAAGAPAYASSQLQINQSAMLVMGSTYLTIGPPDKIKPRSIRGVKIRLPIQREPIREPLQARLRRILSGAVSPMILIPYAPRRTSRPHFQPPIQRPPVRLNKLDMERRLAGVIGPSSPPTPFVTIIN
jgi:hypothetical protein